MELIPGSGSEQAVSTETKVLLRSCGAYGVPRGVWHRIEPVGHIDLVHVTPGPNGGCRPCNSAGDRRAGPDEHGPDVFDIAVREVEGYEREKWWVPHGRSRPIPRTPRRSTHLPGGCCCSSPPCKPHWDLRRRLGTRWIPVFQLPSESDHFLPCEVALLTVVGVHGHLLLRTTEPVEQLSVTEVGPVDRVVGRHEGRFRDDGSIRAPKPGMNKLSWPSSQRTRRR